MGLMDWISSKFKSREPSSVGVEEIFVPNEEIGSHSRDCELVIGLVAPVGVNLDDVQNRLTSLIEQFKYEVNFIHLSQLAKKYYKKPFVEIQNEVARLQAGMDVGRELRKAFGSNFYALLAVENINSKRSFSEGMTVPLFRHIHIIRSLKHTSEIETLRRVYGDGFFLIGISSSIANRKNYLHNLKGVPLGELDPLISRDDKEDGDCGQQTRDVFQMADAFVTTDDNIRLSAQLSRILDLLFSTPVVSPSPDEYAMFMAYAASLRSGDLSRQVGAVIANEHHDIVATGANDVPAFGGGLYWPGDGDRRDHALGYDSNELEKRRIILSVMKSVGGGGVEGDDEELLLKKGKELLKGSGLLDITEYGRAVHAEMEALLSAARNGIRVRGATLYTTTYPCHNCAKHIVAAGVKAVRYIEPYPKSYATKLHGDSIESNGEQAEDKLRFEPFVGIGPRRFVDLFSMALSSGRPLVRKMNGRVKAWDRASAELRVPMTPLSYLEAEVLMVNELVKLTKEADV